LVFGLQFGYSLCPTKKYRLHWRRWMEITLLLKLTKIEEIGWRTEMGGTALLSFRYQVSMRVTS